MVTVVVAEQPLASLTVTVTGPAGKPVAVAVNCAGAEPHTKLNGAVPPVPAAVATPVDWPKQSTLVTPAAGTVAVMAAGAVMVTQAVAVQPLKSVVVTQ